LFADHPTESGCASRRRRGLLNRGATTRRMPGHRHGWRTRDVAIHCFLKIAGPAAAAELAIRIGVDADLLLHVEHAQDLAILQFAQRVRRELAAFVRRARVLECLRSQETADLVGAIGAGWHM